MKAGKHHSIIRSWGNSQNTKGIVHDLQSIQLPSTLSEVPDFITYGNGRSYGDCCLNKNVLNVRNADKVISFDSENGIIHCQSGILLKQLLEIIIPKKWFLPVTPGTKYITLGGAIAADVHGKNHHVEGTFCNYVNWLLLLLPDGTVLKCSREQHADLFHASCGGMGLTGVILEAEFRLKPIKSAFIQQDLRQTDSLSETIDLLDANNKSTYVVAWIDGFAKEHTQQKGLVFLGEHADEGRLHFSFKQPISIPRAFPSFLLNDTSMKLYNQRFLNVNKAGRRSVNIEAFFYPLDRIKNWNRIYGSQGFIQYQLVIPFQNAKEVLGAIVNRVAESDHRSYLSVLKQFGEANANYLSFPMEGYTLTMDFKMKDGLLPFLEELDQIVSAGKGRVYLAKDGRMSREFFEKGYPALEKFREVRKKYQLEKLQSFQSKRLGL
ncbi:FAD-binding protein [Sungkyunkwania multivorans]|uniref:FAD-binding protein n=1 Tax=Sungkyunkwania multivorans TaxID=1173618 RepID=A0ABW3CX36_9FLAO